MLPYIHLFWFDIPSYGLIAVIGCIAAYGYAYIVNKTSVVPFMQEVDLLNIFGIMLVGVLIGAKVLQIITLIPTIVSNWGYLWQNKKIFLDLLSGGGVFYGGMIGGVTAGILYCRKYSLDIKKVLTLLVPCVPLFHFFGRIGCFFGGCCWGIESAYGIVYHNSILAPNGVPLLPIQLIEAFCNLILFMVLAVLSKRLKESWLVLPIYLLAYSVIRFTIEFFRGDTIRGVALLSTSQWISVLIFIAALMWGILYNRKYKRRY